MLRFRFGPTAAAAILVAAGCQGISGLSGLEPGPASGGAGGSGAVTTGPGGATTSSNGGSTSTGPDPYEACVAACKQLDSPSEQMEGPNCDDDNACEIACTADGFAECVAGAADCLEAFLCQFPCLTTPGCAEVPACRIPSCNGMECGPLQTLTGGEPCHDGAVGVDDGFCDTAGFCQECNDSTPCPNGLICAQTACPDNGACRRQCIPASCANSSLDGDETDEDCGGSCSPCGNGDECQNAEDCVSGHCLPATNLCAPCALEKTCRDQGFLGCQGGVCTRCSSDEQCEGHEQGNECGEGRCQPSGDPQPAN